MSSSNNNFNGMNQYSSAQLRKYELFRLTLDEGYAEKLTPMLYDDYRWQAMIQPSSEFNAFTKDITEFLLRLSDVLNNKSDISLEEKLLTDHRLLMVYWYDYFDSGDCRIPSSREKYIDYMHTHFENKYALNRLINLNFLRKHLPDEYEKLTWNSSYSISSVIEDLSILHVNDEDCTFVNKLNRLDDEFHTYERRCRRYIDNVMNKYLPDRVEKKNAGFNILDYCFIAFLLEYMDHPFGESLIGVNQLPNGSKKFKNIKLLADSYYLKTVRFGLISLVYYHYNYQDKEKNNRVSELNQFFDSITSTAIDNIHFLLEDLMDDFYKLDDNNIEISREDYSAIAKSIEDIGAEFKRIYNDSIKS